MIDKLTVELNDKGGFYEVEFTNLGLKKVPIDVDFIKRYRKLFVGGIWAITDVTNSPPTQGQPLADFLRQSDQGGRG